MLKKLEKYFGGHPWLNACSHFFLGAGIGVLINPWAGVHPVRFAAFLILVGLMGHGYAMWAKK